MCPSAYILKRQVFPAASSQEESENENSHFLIIAKQQRHTPVLKWYLAKFTFPLRNGNIYTIYTFHENHPKPMEGLDSHHISSSMCVFLFIFLMVSPMESWKFPGQRLNPSHTCNAHSSNSNTGFFDPLCLAREQTLASVATWATAVRFLTNAPQRAFLCVFSYSLLLLKLKVIFLSLILSTGQHYAASK